MDILEQLRQERLVRTEVNLRQVGLVKCDKCGWWVDNSFVVDKNCNNCRDKTEEDLSGGKWIKGE